MIAYTFHYLSERQIKRAPYSLTKLLSHLYLYSRNLFRDVCTRLAIKTWAYKLHPFRAYSTIYSGRTFFRRGYSYARFFCTRAAVRFANTRGAHA